WALACAMAAAGTVVAQPTVTTIPALKPRAVSADGRVVVGWYNGNYGAYWTRAGGTVVLPRAPLAYTAKANGVSGDGSVIAGHTYTNGQPISSWVWTQ